MGLFPSNLDMKLKKNMSLVQLGPHKPWNLEQFLHFLGSQSIICRICPANFIGSSRTLIKDVEELRRLYENLECYHGRFQG